MKKISENIKNLRLQHGLTQAEFGIIAGASDKAVSTWEKGTAVPRMGSLQRIADHFGITKSSIIEGRIEAFAPANLITPAAHAVPILGVISCGCGVSDDDFTGFFFVDSSVKADYCLRVSGDSMIDAGIQDGDYAFLQKDCEITDGKIYAVVEKCNAEAVLKKLYRTDGKVILQSCNAAYSPIVKEGDEVCVVGELIGVYHAL